MIRNKQYLFYEYWEEEKGSILVGGAGKISKRRLPFEHIFKLFWCWEMNKEIDLVSVDGLQWMVNILVWLEQYINESSEKYGWKGSKLSNFRNTLNIKL